MATAPQPDRPAAGPAPEAATRPGSQVLVLSRDPALLEVLQDVVPNDALAFLSNESELARRLLEGRAGVVVLDTETAGAGAAELARQLHEQLPDLALIAAGTTQDEPDLAPLVASGAIHRFLHKPVSAQRVKLFVEAAWQRHESSVSGAWPALSALPAPAAVMPRGPLLPAAIGAGLVAVFTGVVWLSLRIGAHPARGAAHPMTPAATPPTQETPTVAAAVAPAADSPPGTVATTPPAAAPLPSPALRAPAGVLERLSVPAPVPDLAPGKADAERPMSALLLTKTRFVDPEYPMAARGRDDHGGRVELEYTVRADGSVADIVVTHAQPQGVYEEAAVKAVRQWRYQPIVRDGHPVDQRVYLEMRFAYRDSAQYP